MTEAELKELQELEELEELERLEAASAAPQEPGIGSKILSGAGKALDYVGGITRAGVANVADAVIPGEFATSDDFLNALKANPLTTDEYLERAGVDKGYSLSDLLGESVYSEDGQGWKLKKGGALDPTARGAAGFVGDVALDPLTYLSGGLSAAAKGAIAGSKLQKAGKVAAKVANAAVNPLDMLQKPGAALYRSGWKNIDSRLVEKGHAPVSGYMMDQGVWGRLPSLQKGMKNRMDDLSKQRASLYNEINATGVKIDPDYASRETYDMIKELEKNPYMKPKAEKLREFVDLGQGKKMSIQEASDIKTSLYDALPDSAFDQFGKLTNDGQKMLKTLSKGYKEEIEKAAEFATGKGQQVADINSEWGALINAQKPTRSEIAKANRKNLVTEVKAALTALSGPKGTAAAYGAQGLNSPWFRTGVGLGMGRLGGGSLRTKMKIPYFLEVPVDAPNAVTRKTLSEILKDEEK